MCMCMYACVCGGGSVCVCVYNIVNDFVKFWIRIADLTFGNLITVLLPRNCSSIKIQKNITEALSLQLFVLNVK